jgi:hypothetical protein
MSGIIGGIKGTMKKKFSGQGALLGGTTYDFTGLGPVKSITDLEASAGNLPADGYIKYTISRSGGAGSNVTITTRYKKSGSQLCQSAFALGSSLTVGSTSSILFYGNDDHDTLVMQGDGTGVLCRTNINNWAGSNFDRFRGTNEINTAATFDTCVQYSPSSYISSNNAHLIAFTKTNTNVWWNFTQNTYKVNDFAAQSLPSALSTLIGTGAPCNALMSVSDGVNCFMIYRWGQSTAAYVEIDLSNGTIYKHNTFSFNASLSNGTEEDSEGSQLFAIDGAISYLAGGTFYWGSSTGWRFATGLTSAYTRAVGASTQTDMDIFGSIDANDGYVWFADWGHDDGGLFQVGNDSQLGTAKTNILHIPNNQVV